MSDLHAHDILALAQRHGVIIAVDGSQLRLRAPKPPPPDVLAALRQHKPEIIAALTRSTDCWTERYDERAAIVEEGAGAPRAWAEDFARLDPDQPPHGVSQDQWRRYVDVCGEFIDGGWWARANCMGWSVADVFGVDRHRQSARPDTARLCWTMATGNLKLIALGSDVAVLENRCRIRIMHSKCLGNARQNYQTIS